MSQIYSKLLNDVQLPNTFSGFLALCLSDNDLLVYCDCGRGDRHLKLSFRDVVAYTVYEELSHPSMDRSENDTRPPVSEISDCYYPALEICESEWVKSFSDIRLLHRKESIKHYQFLSYSNILDVLFNGGFSSEIISNAELKSVENFVESR